MNIKKKYESLLISENAALMQDANRPLISEIYFSEMAGHSCQRTFFRGHSDGGITPELRIETDLNHRSIWTPEYPCPYPAPIPPTDLHPPIWSIMSLGHSTALRRSLNVCLKQCAVRPSKSFLSHLFRALDACVA